MPLCPMAMPSSMAMVLNSLAMPPAFSDFTGNQLTHIMQVHVAWDELGEGVGNGDNRFAEVGFHYAGRTPQCACARHIAAVGRGFGAVFRHFCSFILC